MTGAWLVIQFAICAALIGWAGYQLSESADRIARAMGLTGGWIGLALLATVTSLPELASGISAVTVVDAPNLAVGNALGACVFNLLFLVVVDAVQRRTPLYTQVWVWPPPTCSTPPWCSCMAADAHSRRRTRTAPARTRSKP